MERRLHSIRCRAAKSSGENHENLSADAADWYNFDGNPLHFGAGTTI
jgi:hypothetical protein